jgi:hypothetical protein
MRVVFGEGGVRGLGRLGGGLEEIRLSAKEVETDGGGAVS